MESEAKSPVTDQPNTDTVTISRKEYERLQETEHLYNWVLEQLHVTRKKVFGWFVTGLFTSLFMA